MVSLLQIVVLAVVQGITEFLPISSSAHLVLVPVFSSWPDQGLDMDIAVHVGTLGAVILYFWRDCLTMARGAALSLVGRTDPGGRLFWQIALATLPVIAAGLALKLLVGEQAMRSVLVIGWAMLGWGIVLWVVDRQCMTVRRLEHLPWGDAIIIGLAQVLSLIPGTSRAGITMTAARALGYERQDAARFSMLLSIPTILGAGTLAGLDMWQAGNDVLTRDAMMAAGLSFVTALVAIALLMQWLKRASFTPFVIYRVMLGAFLIAFGMGWVSL